MSGGFLFWFFAAVACLGAVAVVVSQSVSRMAVWLIVSLGGAAGLFFNLHADFVGATQLLIYVGGTIVLLIFGVMLTASGPYLRIRTNPGEGFLAAGVGMALLLVLGWTVLGVDWPHVRETQTSGKAPVATPKPEGDTLRPLGLAFAGLRPDRDMGAAQTARWASNSPGYLLPFEIVSVHLLVVLVGAAYLARAKRRQAVPEDAVS